MVGRDGQSAEPRTRSSEVRKLPPYASRVRNTWLTERPARGAGLMHVCQASPRSVTAASRLLDSNFFSAHRHPHDPKVPSSCGARGCGHHARPPSKRELNEGARVGAYKARFATTASSPDYRNSQVSPRVETRQAWTQRGAIPADARSRLLLRSDRRFERQRRRAGRDVRAPARGLAARVGVYTQCGRFCRTCKVGPALATRLNSGQRGMWPFHGQLGFVARRAGARELPCSTPLI